MRFRTALWSASLGLLRSFGSRNSLSFGSIRRSLSTCNSFPVSIEINCEGDKELHDLGASLGRVIEVGDVLLLNGDLGAGKTSLCRGIIRNLCDDANLIVTSPTYLLDNTYEFYPRIYSGSDKVKSETEPKYIHHMDLYRLPTDCDVTMLGIPAIFINSVCLIEWPQRVQRQFDEESFLQPCRRLDVDIRILQKDNSTNNTSEALNSEKESYSDDDSEETLEMRKVVLTAHGSRWLHILQSLKS